MGNYCWAIEVIPKLATQLFTTSKKQALRLSSVRKIYNFFTKAGF